MKTWQEFNDTVNDLLLVDGLRRGRGIERFKDRMIVAGVRDLQSYIPELRTTPKEQTFITSDLEDHAEGKCQIGNFNIDASRVLDVVIRAMPTQEDDVSQYYRPNVYPAYKRYNIFDGGHAARSPQYPGKITFDRGQFYVAPKLLENETLNILYNQEYVYKPLFDCQPEEKAVITPLGDDAALAVHYFVKYHFMKDVNDDTAQAKSNFDNYARERRRIHVNKPELLTNVQPTDVLGSEGFVLGNG